MSRASADHNLLFSLLALQNNLIAPAAIVAAFHTWTCDKSRPMGEIFVEQGAIDAAQRELLGLLVDAHLRKHGGDVEQSLAALGSAGVLRRDLEAIADPDLSASLAYVHSTPELDPDATRPYSPGPETPGQGPQTPGQRYKILRFHARGGLGEVFVASDEELHREVALKQIQVAHADDPDSRSRFVVEAEITGGLEHPGIVPVYGLGHYTNGRPYYAMRFIKGESLRESIRQFHQAEQPGRDPGARSLELRQLLRRFLDVCNAVAYAHSRGVLHRDLKPSNVMLGAYGETLVVDWGLAKVIGRADGAGSELTLRPSSGSDVQATRAGVAIGTLSYMSPEQARGDLEKLGPATDVYSLGATLYHVLTGRAPFGAPGRAPFGEGDVAEILARVIVGDFPRLRQVRSNIPAALEAICLKAMMREPQDRYATPRGLADDVEHWLADEPVSAWREPLAMRLRRWGRRHRTSVAVAAGLLIVAALGVYIAQLRVERQKTATALAQEENQHYFSRIVLAEREWRAMNIRRTEGLLAECPPARRGWEWRYLKRRCHEELGTLRGHTGTIWGLAVSPDGRLIASASNDKTVKLWNASSLQLIRTLEHPSAVWSVAFSPDSRRLASSAAPPSEPGEVTIWDLETGRPLQTLPTRNGLTADVAFSPDGTRLASTSGDREGPHEVIVWDLATGRKELVFTRHDDVVCAVAFSPDGRKIVSASGTQDGFADTKPGVAIVWDAGSGEVLATFHGHTQTITHVAFRPDGRQVATTSWDKTIRIWDAATGAELRTLRGHTNIVASVAFRNDGRQLASGGEDNAVKLWDPDTGLEIATFRGHSDTVNSVAYVGDGRRLVSVSDDSTVRLWDATRVGPTRSLSEFTGRVTAVVFGPSGKLVAAASEDRSLKIWDEATGREVLRIEARAGPIWGLALSPDGRRVAAAMGDWRLTDQPGIVRVWDTTNRQELFRRPAHLGVAWSVAYSPDGRLLASGGGELHARPGEVILWDAATGQEIRTLRGHRGGIGNVVFSPDGKHLASSGGDATVRIWEVSSERELRTLRADGWNRCVAYSPDGTLLAADVEDHQIRLWDPATGREIATLRGHMHPIHCLAFHPDGTRLASGSGDESVKIWDVVTGQEILTLPGHAGGVRSVAFSPPDGRMLASAGADRMVKIWDAPLIDTSDPVLAAQR
jgi:WD40 repeat protein/tRNA A-37 threonylcarbamoyl transferase component Bud32